MSPVLRNRNCGIVGPKSGQLNKLNKFNLDDENDVRVSESISNSPSSPAPQSPSKSVEDKVSECLYEGEVVDLDKLRKLSWNGIPSQYRALCWKILMVQRTIKYKCVFLNSIVRDICRQIWIDTSPF